MTEADNRARWDGRRGRYEVWFVTLSRPDGRAGYWVRYSMRAPISGPPESRLWFARFDRDHPARTFGLNGPPPGAGGDGDIQPGALPLLWGHATCEAGAARGGLAGAGHQVRWDLRWDTDQESFRVLPPILYRPGMAPTRPYSPNPAARVSGRIQVDGEEVLLEEWPGQQGHLEGTRHAERWAWASCAAYREGYAVQALSAQGRRGPVLMPMLTFGGVRVDGRWVRLRGVGRARTWSLGRWRVRLRSKSYRLEGQVTADPEGLLQARYLDPDDRPRWCHNTEVAASRFLLWERRAGGWQELAELVSDGTTHAEWAGTTPAPGSFARHVEVA